MVKLHWKKITMDQLGEDSIWSSPSKDGTATSNGGIDEDEKSRLKTMFASKKSSTKSNTKNSSSKSNNNKSNTSVAVLDPKRSHNVEICLSKFRSFTSYDDVASSLSNMNFNTLRPDVVLLFRSVLPTNDETTKLKAHVEGPRGRNDEDTRRATLEAMTKAEKFMFTLSKVRLGKAKAEGMIFLSEIPEMVRDLTERVRAVIGACDQVIQCDALVIVLRKILAVGNTMNEGSHVGEAVGFALESLPRLWSTKGQDRKTTVLDFVVRMLLARDPELADLPQRLTRVSSARTTIQSDLLSRVSKIEMRLKTQVRLANKKGEPYDDDDANERFGKEIRRWEDRIVQLSSDRNALLEKGKSLAAYFGEASDTCTPEKVFRVLHEFAFAFGKSVKECEEMKRRLARVEQKQHNNMGVHQQGGAVAGNSMKRRGGSVSIAQSMSSSPMLAEMRRRRQMVVSSSFDDDDDDDDDD
jgi:formin 2